MLRYFLERNVGLFLLPLFIFAMLLMLLSFEGSIIKRIFKMALVWASVFILLVYMVGPAVNYCIGDKKEHGNGFDVLREDIYKIINIKQFSDHAVSDAQIQSRIDEIYDKYGIQVYVGLDYDEAFHSDITKTEVSPEKSETLSYLQKLEFALSLYSDKALKKIPKEIYLVNYAEELNKEVYGLNVIDKRIVLSVKSGSKTIHHEIFHSLDSTIALKDYLEFENSSESCELTSNYACTSNIELLAEAWSHGLSGGKDNEHIKILKRSYSKLLKADKNALPVDQKEEAGEFLKSNLNANQITAYFGLETIFNQGVNSIVLPVEVEDMEKVYEVFWQTHPEFAKAETLTTYCVEGKQYICLDESELFSITDDIRKADGLIAEYVGSLPDLNEYEKIRKIYLDCIGMTKDAEEIRKSNPSVYGKQMLLHMLLEKAGINNIYTENGVIVNYENKYYRLCPNQDNGENNVLYGFMTNDRSLTWVPSQKESSLIYPCCEDRYPQGEGELCLTDLDKDAIDEYLLSRFRNFKAGDKLVFRCNDAKIMNEVCAYLSEEQHGLSRLQRIFAHAVESDYYPGYSIVELRNVLIVEKFKF